jgi:hypothetical protein
MAGDSEIELKPGLRAVHSRMALGPRPTDVVVALESTGLPSPIHLAPGRARISAARHMPTADARSAAAPLPRTRLVTDGFALARGTEQQPG